MTRDLPLILWLIPLLILAAGIALTWIGWRGRTIDNHPICRKCGFDLFALDQAVKCPECGTNLSAKAIRLGHRALRRMPFVFGLLLLLPSLTIVAALGVATVKNVDLDRYKPVWWLLRDADWEAVNELQRRLESGTVSDAQIASVVEKALRVQEDESQRWMKEWGTFVEVSRLKGKIADAQWVQYARQAPRYELVVRPRLGIGDSLPYDLRESASRVGASQKRWGTQKRLITFCGRALLRIGDATTRTNQISGEIEPDSDASGVSSFGWFDMRPLLANATPGIKFLHVEAEIDVFDSWPDVLQRKRPITVRKIEFDVQFDLLAPGESSVKLIDDSRHRFAVEHALSISSVRFTGKELLPLHKLDWRSNIPPIAYDLSVRIRDREIQTGSLMFLPGGLDGAREVASPVTLESEPPAIVNVILKPNPKLAARTIDILEIWDGQLEFKNVPVIARQPATVPTTAPLRR